MNGEQDIPIREEIETILDSYAKLIKDLIYSLSGHSNFLRGLDSELIQPNRAVSSPVEIMKNIVKTETLLQRCAIKLKSHQERQSKISAVVELENQKNVEIALLADNLRSYEEELQTLIKNSKEAIQSWDSACDGSVDLNKLIKYAQLTSTTSGPPPWWNPSMPLPPQYQPPMPLEQNIRSGLLFRRSAEQGSNMMVEETEPELTDQPSFKLNEELHDDQETKTPGKAVVVLNLGGDEELDEDAIVWD